jgi:hypothetical protein
MLQLPNPYGMGVTTLLELCSSVHRFFFLAVNRGVWHCHTLCMTVVLFVVLTVLSTALLSCGMLASAVTL